MNKKLIQSESKLCTSPEYLLSKRWSPKELDIFFTRAQNSVICLAGCGKRNEVQYVSRTQIMKML